MHEQEAQSHGSLFAADQKHSVSDSSNNPNPRKPANSILNASQVQIVDSWRGSTVVNMRGTVDDAGRRKVDASSRLFASTSRLLDSSGQRLGKPASVLIHNRSTRLLRHRAKASVGVDTSRRSAACSCDEMQLGEPSWLTPTTFPVTSRSVMTTADSHTCGITMDAAALCWGSNTYGTIDLPSGHQWQVTPALPS